MSVCVNPCYIKDCYEFLKGSDVKVCTVIGFPLGDTDKDSKAFEARKAIENGASEVDMVINVSYIKSNRWDEVKEDVKAVREASKGKLVKVILETCLLTDEEIVKSCLICKELGCDFVKTSTGFSKFGATVHHVKLMRDTVGAEMGVKASGGIRDAKAFLEMIEAGANRIGASAGVKILEDLK